LKHSYDGCFFIFGLNLPRQLLCGKIVVEEVAQRNPIENIITHQFSLQEGAKAYEVFDKKLNNCIKAILLTLV